MSPRLRAMTAGERRDHQKLADLWRRHRLRPEDWHSLWTSQGGRCYLCGDPLSDGKNLTHVDHDHSCCPKGYSCSFCRRGLACSDCNHIIGRAKDDPDRLRRIADALESTMPAVLRRIADKPQQELLPVPAL